MKLHVLLGLIVLLHAYGGLTVLLQVIFRLTVKFLVPQFQNNFIFKDLHTVVANSDHQLRHACTSVRLSAHNNVTFTGRIFMQFLIFFCAISYRRS